MNTGPTLSDDRLTVRLDAEQAAWVAETARAASVALGVDVSRSDVLRRLIDRERGASAAQERREDAVAEMHALTEDLDRQGVEYDVGITIADDGSARFRVVPKQLPAGTEQSAVVELP